MGIVYKAEDTTLEHTVALKFLAPDLLNEDEAKERFLRDAGAAAGINHANICHVHEIGGRRDLHLHGLLRGRIARRATL